jgi:hypothetical protein
MALLGDGKLAVTERVPEFDGLVPGTRNDLSVVGAKGDAEDVVGVADETTGGFARGQVPQAEGLVPRGREGVLAVGRDDNVLDKVVVALRSANAPESVIPEASGS